MINSDMTYNSANIYNERISQFSLERSRKIERLKQAVNEGTYHCDSKKLANKLITLILSSGTKLGSATYEK